MAADYITYFKTHFTSSVCKHTTGSVEKSGCDMKPVSMWHSWVVSHPPVTGPPLLLTHLELRHSPSVEQLPSPVAKVLW